MRPSSLVLLFGAGVVALILGLFTEMALSSRERLLEAQAAENDKLADSLEQHVKGTLALAEMVLTAVQERLDREAGLAPFSPEFDRFLARLTAKAPGLAGIRVIDRSGKFVHSHPTVPGEDVRIDDRDYFRVHADGTHGLFIGKPIVSRVSGKWVLPISLALRHGSGGFDGIVTVVLNLAELGALFDSVRTKPNGAISLFRGTDAVLLMRAPTSESMIGQAFANGPLFREHLPKSPRGRYMRVVATDKTLRLASYRAVPEFQVVLGVSSSYGDIDGLWLRSAGKLAAIGTALAIAAAAATWTLRRQLLAREASEALLARKSEDLELANEELRQMAVITAHHLQEPLRTVLSYAQLLIRRAPGGGDEAGEYVGFIKSGIERMKGQLTALERYLAIQPGEDGGRQPIDLGVLTEEVGREYDGDFKAAGLSVRRCGALPTVRGSQRQIRTLFRTLFDHALHARRNPDAAVIEITARRLDGGLWQVSMADPGARADDKALDSLFRAERGCENLIHGGPTLGLALCRKIAHLHGGRLWIDAAETGGTVIRFTLAG